MKNISLIFILFLIIISCKKQVQEVEPTLQNLNHIINSDNFIIRIDMFRGSVIGVTKYRVDVEIDENQLDLKSEQESFSIELNNINKKSLKNILIKILKKHKDDKKISHSCFTSDQNYILENDTILIELKPIAEGGVYDEIIRIKKENDQTVRRY